MNSRIGWRGILAAQEIGAVGALPRVQTIDLNGRPGVHWQTVGWADDTPPVPVIYVGTPGPRQKAVVHLVDPAFGRCHSIVKVPLQAAARTAIVRESGVLATLEEEACQVSPRLMYLDDSRCIATQSYLEGSSGSRKLLPEYLELLQSLALPDEHTTLTGHTVDWRDHSLWNVMERNDLALVTSALAEQFDATSLPAFWAHGDFAPWNIRHHDHLPPDLVDWEMGERGALPLQDAFHFLHIQQFLFRRRRTSHSADLAPFAKRIGVPHHLCRKLEIAYLTRSLFTCLESVDHCRAQSLLKSIALVMNERARSTVCPGVDRRLRLVTSRPANHRAARFELLSALITRLNRAGVPYCVLSGHENTQETHTSDVDIMFRPADLKLVPELLTQCAASSGAQLVQSIRHETSACYFVLARSQGKHIAHLAVDCYGDYRRDDRTWLRADKMVANRRKFRDFDRPSVADEFIYRLIKKVLKQSFSTHYLRRLQHLFARDAVVCRERIARLWPAGTAIALERNLLDQNHRWFREHLPTLALELHRSPKEPGPFARFSESVRNASRLLQRILFPTGMFVSVVADAANQHEEVADGLVCSLAPAFRRTMKLPVPESLFQSIPRGIRIQIAKIRSTLVIEEIDLDRRSLFGMRLSWPMIHLFAKPDVILRFDTARISIRGRENRRQAAKVFYLHTGVGLECPTEQANSAILSWLAARTAKRHKITVAARAMRPNATPSPAVGECEFVGSD